MFLPSILIWRKTRKRKPLTLSFIEEAWICRRGAIFQRFSVKRRQAQGERESESRARRIRIIKKKKGIRSQGPFPFFNKMEHSLVKCSLLLLIVLVTSKLPPEQNYSAARNLCDKWQRQHKINLILVTYQLKKNDKYSNWILCKY